MKTYYYLNCKMCNQKVPLISRTRKKEYCDQCTRPRHRQIAKLLEQKRKEKIKHDLIVKT